MKILLVEAELFHADGRTDMTKLIIAFRSFANAPKNAWKKTIQLYQVSSCSQFHYHKVTLLFHTNNFTQWADTKYPCLTQILPDLQVTVK